MVNKKIVLTIIVFFFLLLFGTKPVSAATYYVSTSGNDSNTTTQAQNSNTPWKTIQRAATAVSGGNTILVNSGTYNERVSVSNSGASSSNPLVFDTQGTAIVKGFVIRTNYITIKNFEIANSDKDNAGVHIKGAYNIIENNYIHHNASHGIEFYGYPIDNSVLISHDNIVRNNRLYYNGGAGIIVNGRNNLIENNEIWGNQQCLSSNGGNCIDPDGMDFFGQGHIFRGNYIHDIPFGPLGINPSIGDYNDDAHIDCFQTFVSDYGEQASNILFEGNYCDNLQFQNDFEKGQGWMLSGGAHDITFRNNVVRAYRGINTNGVTSFADHLYVYNNTFINDLSFPAQPNFAELVSPIGSIIKNNIFYNEKDDIVELSGDTTGYVIDYNLIYNTDGSLPKKLSYPVQHELRKVSPQFVNLGAKDYHIKATLPNGSPNPVCTGGEGGTYIGAYPCGSSVNPSPTPLIKRGDINGDGVVDILDIGIVVDNFKKNPINNTAADLDKNGAVDIVDLGLVIDNYGK